LTSVVLAIILMKDYGLSQHPDFHRGRYPAAKMDSLENDINEWYHQDT
jgi:hypothetical protein